MARLVHDLARQEQRDLVVVRANVLDPAAWHIAGNKLDLRQEGAELAHRQLDVFRQLRQFVPRDVRSRTPLSLVSFLVQHGDGL